MQKKIFSRQHMLSNLKFHIFVIFQVLKISIIYKKSH